nr:hypothetical protein [Ornithinimicrobium ciconiae]
MGGRTVLYLGVPATGDPHDRHPPRAPPGRGTRIELAIIWTGPGAWLARALFGRMTQRYIDIDLNSLVTAAEAEPSA